MFVKYLNDIQLKLVENYCQNLLNIRISMQYTYITYFKTNKQILNTSITITKK